MKGLGTPATSDAVQEMSSIQVFSRPNLEKRERIKLEGEVKAQPVSSSRLLSKPPSEIRPTQRKRAQAKEKDQPQSVPKPPGKLYSNGTVHFRPITEKSASTQLTRKKKGAIGTTHQPYAE